MTITSIAQYRLEGLLGGGRHTETYQAFDLVHRRPVALKLLRPNLIPGNATGRAFLAQAQRAAELVHPRIAWIWETGEAEGRYFLVERFVAGESLAAHLKRTGPLAWDQAMPILERIAQAVEFAEERGWRHGRVTPNNILLGSDLGAVLSDYGLANAFRQIFPGAAPSLFEAQYLPPEVLQSQPITPRADLYMLACTLIEMLLGKNPFAGDTLAEIEALKATTSDQVLLPIESTPAGAGEVVKRALSADPSARFSSSPEFVDALRRAVSLGLTDSAARAQHAEQVRLWREAKEQSRLEGEEAARLAALEQARREIQERARQEAELVVGPAEEIPLEPGEAAAEAGPGPRPSRRASTRLHERRRPILRQYWPIVAVILLVALALGGNLLGGQGWLAGQVQPSPSPTKVESTSTLPVVPPTVMASATPIPSRTPSPSASQTPTRTPSRTPSRTPRPTLSRTPAASPTSTFAPATSTSTNLRLDPDD